MQVKLVNKRYLVFRSAYITKDNGNIEEVIPRIRKENKWQNINLFEENLEEYFNWQFANHHFEASIKDEVIDLVKCFEWLMCFTLAILFIVYLIDMIKRW